MMNYVLTFIFGTTPLPRKVSDIIGRFSVEKKMVNRRLKPYEFLTPSPVLAGVLKKKFHIFMYMYLFTLHSIINGIIIDTI